MKTSDSRASFPVGVRPLLFEETEKRRRVESRITGALEEAAYREIVLPIVDFTEPYAGFVSESVLKKSYRFTDREGELLSVRRDFTPMVARVLAPVVDEVELPLRLFYRGDVIRCEPTRLGRDREMFQIGAELIGGAGIDADIEVLRLAIAAVRGCGIQPVVALSDASLLARLLTFISPADRSEVIAQLREGRSESLSFGDQPAHEEASAIAAMYSASSGELEGMPILGKLREIRDAVKSEATCILSMDVDPASYYTGPRFEIFSDLRSAALASGGRYDSLYARFGADVPAVGFTINVDLLEAR